MKPRSELVRCSVQPRAAGTENSDPAAAEEFLAAETGAPDAAPGGTAGSSGGSGEPDDGAGPGLSWYGVIAGAGGRADRLSRQ